MVSASPDIETVLRTSFGLQAFRDGQREIIDAVLRGEDALVVRPTGSGKSLCYQLPACMLPGVTVVVSPLIALMRDQLEALAARGLAATAIHSGLGPGEAAEALSALRQRRTRIVYVAPERFRAPSFIETLAGLNVSLLAIDEAHCVSEWGHEFRPDYRRLGAAREQLGRPRVLALTATATARVRRDILDELAIPDASVFVSGFDRPNLFFEVARTPSREEKLAHLRALVRGVRKSGAGLIYCSTRKQAEEVGERLRCGVYHAGLESRERTRIQDEFMSGESAVLAATNAFGMGVDRADVRFVAHFQLPRSLEAYYQEAGRAGRDGGDARCVLLYSYADRNIHDFLIDESTPEPGLVKDVWRGLLAGESPDDIAVVLAGRGKRPRTLAVDAALTVLERAGHVARRRAGVVDLLDRGGVDDLRVDFTAVGARRAHETERLEKMIAYASRDRCRTRQILDYFGDRSAVGARNRCGHCDACGVTSDVCEHRGTEGRLPTGGEDAQVVLRKVLSCVARIGWSATRTAVSGCLAGSRAARVIESGHDRLSTYGILREVGREAILAWIDALAKEGLLALLHGRVALTKEGVEVMSGRKPAPEALIEGAAS